MQRLWENFYGNETKWFNFKGSDTSSSRLWYFIIKALILPLTPKILMLILPSSCYTSPCKSGTRISCQIRGPVVQRPISSNPGLNFNPAFFISLFKSLFGKIFTILFRTSNDQIASKNIWTEFSLKVFRPEIKFHTNPGLP